jgi:hypothetical protein
MTKIDDATVNTVRFNQRVRDAMRKHGMTEIVDAIYTKGDIVGSKMAVVSIFVELGATDAEIAQAAAVAAETYANKVKEGPASAQGTIRGDNGGQKQR